MWQFSPMNKFVSFVLLIVDWIYVLIILRVLPLSLRITTFAWFNFWTLSPIFQDSWTLLLVSLNLCFSATSSKSFAFLTMGDQDTSRACAYNSLPTVVLFFFPLVVVEHSLLTINIYGFGRQWHARLHSLYWNSLISCLSLHVQYSYLILLR